MPICNRGKINHGQSLRRAILRPHRTNHDPSTSSVRADISEIRIPQEADRRGERTGRYQKAVAVFVLGESFLLSRRSVRAFVANRGSLYVRVEALRGSVVAHLTDGRLVADHPNSKVT